MKNKSKMEFVIFSLATLAITFPILKNGFVLTLDSIISPVPKMPLEFSADYFWKLLIFILSAANPIVMEKVVIMLIVFMLFLSVSWLMKTFSFWIRIFGSFMVVFSSFFYFRFVTGQFRLLAGAVILLIIVNLSITFFQSLDKSSKKQMFAKIIALLLLLLGGMVIYPRLLTYLSIFLISLSLAFSLKTKITTKNALILLPLAAMAGISVFSEKIIAFLGKISSSVSADTQIGFEHVDLFSGKLTLWQTLANRGNWIEKSNRYIIPETIQPAWTICFAILAFMSVAGIILLFREKNRDRAIFGLTFVIALILSATALLSSEQSWYASLTQNNVFFLSFRDNSKLFLFILLGEIVLASFFIEWLFSKFKMDTVRYTLIGFCLLFPMFYNPQVLAGACGQIQAVKYPGSWYDLNVFLKHNSDGKRTLFLPWHQYMTMNFTKNVILNPAPFFFEVPVIAGDAIEFGSIYTQSTDKDSEVIAQLIDEKVNIADSLMRLNVKYIVNLKTVDFESYKFIEKDSRIKVLKENDDFILYAITN